MQLIIDLYVLGMVIAIFAPFFIVMRNPNGRP